jgi:hypothetical protein
VGVLAARATCVFRCGGAGRGVVGAEELDGDRRLNDGAAALALAVEVGDVKAARSMSLRCAIDGLCWASGWRRDWCVEVRRHLA